MYRLFT